MNLATKEFIRLHENDDIFTLKLKFGKAEDVDLDLAIRQIIGKQKVKHKIPAFYANDDILYPSTLSLEQSSSESTAKYKSTLCEGNNLIDLTGGFGIDCCFMSEKFRNTIYIERQEELCVLARHNFAILGKPNIEVINTTSEEFLPHIEQVDWIFIDPARRSHDGKKVVLLSDCEPDISLLAPVLLTKSGAVMVKLSPMMDITAALRDLPSATEVHIISVENECKEVLILLKQKPVSSPLIKTINFCKSHRTEQLEFHINDENEAIAHYQNAPARYLYEPNASVMKSGAFKLISSRFDIYKLSNNTHLYTSSELIIEFPGRIFEVQKVWGNSKNELKEMCQKLTKANIATRNYPLTAEELKKKLKMKDGGDSYLIACTLADGTKSIIECSRYR